MCELTDFDDPEVQWRFLFTFKFFSPHLDKFSSTSGGMTFRPEYVKTGEWRKVAPDQAFPFSFEDRSKQRHRNTRELRVHQVGKIMNGWIVKGLVNSVKRISKCLSVGKPTSWNLPFISSLSSGCCSSAWVESRDSRFRGQSGNLLPGCQTETTRDQASGCRRLLS